MSAVRGLATSSGKALGLFFMGRKDGEAVLDTLPTGVSFRYIIRIANKTDLFQPAKHRPRP